MKKFNSEFWHKLCGMIGYVLIGVSLIGKESVGGTYNYTVGTGIIAIFICIFCFILKEFEGK